MLHLRRAACAGLVLAAAGCQPSRPASAGVSSRAGSPAVGGALTAVAAAGGVAGSLDERGVPHLIVAATRQPAPAGATLEQAARAHLARHAAGLGATAATVDQLELAQARPLGGGGALVRMRQRIGGVEVFRGQVAVLLRADRALHAIAGQLEAGPLDRAPFADPAAALAAALAQHTGVAVAPSSLIDLGEAAGGFRRFQLAGGPLALVDPARVKPVYFAVGPSRRLVPAELVELRLAGGAPDSWRFVVAADGSILHRQDLTAWDAFNYRVFADAAGDHRPTDGPQADWTPYPKPMPDGSRPPFVAPNLIAMEGFNHNPQGAADPWLPAAATVTTGNNVDAYTDRNAPDGFSNGDFRAGTTGPAAFDRVYDFGAEPTASNDQAMAGIVNAFYVTNWLHDWWYDSGFDEAAGNAQSDNFGRGGAGGDRMHVETQDDVFGAGHNNSNMDTPSDGMSPRMQVYVWNGPDAHSLTVTPPGAQLANAAAGFGPSNFNVTAPVVLVNDGNGAVTDGCQPITNNVSGKIALIDRGTCTFKQKVVNAQAAGAAGVIIADNKAANTPPDLADGAPNVAVNIGALSVTLADGNSIKANLQQGAVTATLARTAEPTREGALDNSVLAHEWGHYLHHRLADCGLQQCSAMSEGWGDFLALHTMLREGDDLNGTYAVGIYADQYQGDSPYFGLRRQPYTVDMSKNGLSFRHISDGAPLPNTLRRATGGPNSEVHNAGEVWATMLFEGYVALQQAGPSRMPPLSFDEVRRRMGDYVVAGLQMTPPEATYTEARDAILAAAAARDPDDLAVLAAAFARRGAGTCAQSPPRDSMDLVGVVESGEVKPRIVIGAVTLDDSVHSCDSDGVLDAEERGKLTLHVANGGPAPMVNTTLSVTSATPGVSFPLGATATLPAIAPLTDAVVTLDVALDKSAAPRSAFALDLTVDNGASCEGEVKRSLAWRVNYDEIPMSSATDDVESDHTAWTIGGMNGDKVWSRVEAAPLQHVWHGADFGSVSDTWLESPDLQVSAGASFKLAMSHRYRFETGDNMGQPANFDGAVIEVSSDGGASWSDASGFAAVPYGGVITDVSGNPLANRMALVGQNAAWPNNEPVMLDFGKAFAGKTVRVRFRIGTDQAAAFEGWDIDDLAFSGIDNTPFAAAIDDRGECSPAPAVDGGADQAMAAASADAAADAGQSTLADSGCGCALGARPPRGALATAAALLALALLLARRRR